MSAGKAKGTPCIYCGGPKEPGRGRRVCFSCEESRKPLILQRQYQDRLKRKREGTLAPGAKGRKPAPDGHKWCGRCAEYRPLSEFAENTKGRVGYCRPCNSLYLHERVLQKEYGITLNHYMDLVDAQDGRCAICQTQPRKRRLSVDHDHASGEVRGLLCTRCNHKLLGAAHDSSALLRRAAAYLEAPPARTGRAIPSDLGDLMELLLAAWLLELEESKAAVGSSIGAIWIEPPSGKPGDGHVILTTQDYEALCDRARAMAGGQA